MHISRRAFLHQSGLLAGYALLPGWLGSTDLADATGQQAARAIAQPHDGIATDTTHAAALHLLNRITFGPRPGDVARVAKLGPAAFLEQQLNPQQIDDRALERRLAALPVLTLDNAALYARYRPGEQPGPRRAIAELQAAALLRAVASERQLLEVMVDFWSNHLHVSVAKRLAGLFKIGDDRDVVRPHALGTFHALLLASARSPAMLLFLDNARNTKLVTRGGTTRGGINENYARELLELHTVGANAGYSQDDVVAIAHVLTGWTVTPQNDSNAGAFRFVPNLHDSSAQRVGFLDLNFAAGHGVEAGELLLRRLAEHPSTARRLATKLAAHFVSEPPPPALVERAAQAYLQGGTDIRATLRVILTSPEFAAAAGQKIKLPLRFVASAVRALGADLQLTISGRAARQPGLLQALTDLGQAPFLWAPPNGYPQAGAAWINTSGLLGRWNLAFALAEGQVAGVTTNLRTLAGSDQAAASVDALAATLLPGGIDDRLRTALVAYAEAGWSAATDRRRAGVTGLLLATPAFQLH